LEASVPFAKSSGYAAVAGNAAKLNGHVSSTSGKAGTIPVVGKNGQLPAKLLTAGSGGAAGTAGPPGPAGAAGPPGPAGISGYQVVTETKAVGSLNPAYGTDHADCPTGKNVLGGGATLTTTDGSDTAIIQLEQTYPVGGKSWAANWDVPKGVPGGPGLLVTIYAICANVST
jgi:hypothetical protein